MAHPPFVRVALPLLRQAVALFLVAPMAALPQTVPAQQEQPTPAAQQPSASPQQSAPAAAPASTPEVTVEPQATANSTLAPAGSALPISEEVVQRRLVGKQFFLRGGWQGDSLNFSEHGQPVGHPATGSFTLSVIEVNKVNLTKHRLEIEGHRYALHFFGNLPYENSASEVERINITPKKKSVHIAIDRERLIKPKKEKAKKEKNQKPTPIPNTSAASSPETTELSQPAAPAPTTPAPAETTPAPAAPASQPAETQEANETAEPAPLSSDITYTTSPTHAAQLLNEALDRIFASELDDKMRASIPEFWQLYYQSKSAGSLFDPHDPAVFRATTVDQQARLLTSIAPQSNEFAQANGIVGQALYRVVVAADGTIKQIAVERPIGFGLDENAVAAIRKATFSPAIKNGQPVAELLDLSVVFRIYSNRTSATPSAQPVDASGAGAAPAAVKPALPGPYSAQHPPAPQEAQPQPATQQDAAPATPPAAPDANMPPTTPPANPPASPQTAPQS